MEYATEDDPHEPTNVPEGLEEKAHRVFEYTKETSGSGHTQYVKPLTGTGYPDYELMLDLMGLTIGTVFCDGELTMVVTGRPYTTVQWGGEFEVPNGSLEAVVVDRASHVTVAAPGDRRRWYPAKEHMSPISLWERYIHGEIRVYGNAADLVD